MVFGCTVETHLVDRQTCMVAPGEASQNGIFVSGDFQ